jgi:hypothetical protein
MVRAGIKKNNVQYDIPNIDCRLAWLTINISCPNSHVKNPVKPRKATNMIYAINELKKADNS